MRMALTIAGSDPSGGAGLQADLKVFWSLGVHGLSVPAALTAQNTEEVRSIMPVRGEFLRAELDVLLADLRPDALKTGMLHTAGAVQEVRNAVERHRLDNLVVDPVSVSSSGTPLLEEAALEVMRESLLPVARVITPNVYEAQVLTGVAIETLEEMREAARSLKALGPRAVVITGGHFGGAGEDRTLDLYFDGTDMVAVEDRRYEGRYHGTGCAFSAAVAAHLALGAPPLEAVRKAKDAVSAAIRGAWRPGRGRALLRL
ncbi:MAG: bifunctional hydroxymethylpyrimidine kinase/phosphomethylpyrimidine kinase [Nitrospirota bacterium]|jgi:hydroxymethylpyrimidine/phosphomethylpyrimidine kinase